MHAPLFDQSQADRLRWSPCRDGVSHSRRRNGERIRVDHEHAREATLVWIEAVLQPMVASQFFINSEYIDGRLCPEVLGRTRIEGHEKPYEEHDDDESVQTTDTTSTMKVDAGRRQIIPAFRAGISSSSCDAVQATRAGWRDRVLPATQHDKKQPDEDDGEQRPEHIGQNGNGGNHHVIQSVAWHVIDRDDQQEAMGSFECQVSRQWRVSASKSESKPPWPTNDDQPCCCLI